MSTRFLDGTRIWTEAELQALADEKHEHSYIETLDSKNRGVRTFKCSECGAIRIVDQVAGTKR